MISNGRETGGITREAPRANEFSVAACIEPIGRARGIAATRDRVDRGNWRCGGANGGLESRRASGTDINIEMHHRAIPEGLHAHVVAAGGNRDESERAIARGERVAHGAARAIFDAHFGDGNGAAGTIAHEALELTEGEALSLGGCGEEQAEDRGATEPTKGGRVEEGVQHSRWVLVRVVLMERVVRVVLGRRLRCTNYTVWREAGVARIHRRFRPIRHRHLKVQAH